MRLICPHCGYSKDTPLDAFPPDVHQAACPRCGKTFDLPPAEPEDQAAPDQATPDQAAPDRPEPNEPEAEPFLAGGEPPPRLENRPGSPWDHVEHLGVWSALKLTAMGVLVAPNRFFRNMYLRGGFGRPLIFAVITGTIGLSAALLWTVLLAPPQFFTQLKAHFGVGGSQVTTIVIMGLVIVPLVPVLVVYLMAFLTHVVVVLFRDNNHGFEATFRVTAFSFAAVLLLIVPFIGHLIAFFWTVAVRIIGLIQAQETTPVKATVAVLWPYLFLLLLFNQALPGLG
jgi:hypothetical protein